MELNKDEFKRRVYDPYAEAWEIMKWFRDAEPKDDKCWKAYDDKCEAFRKKYNSEIGGDIYKVLLDAAHEVGKIGKM